MIIFIGFTVLKAGYIVLGFMHLGDEVKVMKWTILTPFTMFVIYLVYIVTAEGTYSMDYRVKMDKKILEQKANSHHEASAHEPSSHHEE